MTLRLLGIVTLLALSFPAWAQQPTPLFNAQPAPPFPPAPPGAADQSVPAQTLPPPDQLAPPPAGAQAQPSPPTAAPMGHIFCEQNVTAQAVRPSAVPERYRPFAGIFSDADWNPQTCAALVVEAIADDGTATITYAFGPITPGGKAAGGVLHGTGVIKENVLLFQNSDGSQYAFQPFYTDLAGKWTTPKGQTFEAVFKRTF